MKFNTLLKFGWLLATLATMLLSGCTKDEGIDNRDHGYGYAQFRLYKNGTTRASDKLEYLRDAKKIQVFFRHENRNFNQTLLLSYSNDEASEFGLRSESIKLSSGEYQVIGYTIFDNMENEIMNVIPSEQILVRISDGNMSMQDLGVDAVLRGKIYFRLTKQLPVIDSRVAIDRDEYTFKEIKYADIELVDAANSKNVLQFTKMKCIFKMDVTNGTSSVLCDTLYVNAGTYRLKSFWLRDAGEKTIDYAETFSPEVLYSINDVTAEPLQEVAVPVKINSTARYIKDYIALREIWRQTGGTKDPDRKAWYYIGENSPVGANWDFDKDVDLWGNQPGVTLHNNGRVAVVNIGGFDPHGEIPSAIGELTELTQLFLGTHNDAISDDAGAEFDKNGIQIGINLSKRYTGKYANNSGTEYDPWTYVMRGESTSTNRMERAAREMQARNAYQSESALFSSMRKMGQLPSDGMEGITTYADVDYGYITNHITGIHPDISKCTKLEALYVANSYVETLPESMSTLVNLTTLELYNNPLMKAFPMVLAKFPNLAQANLAQNYQWTSQVILDGVSAMFNSGDEGPAKKVQVLYLNNNRLTELPAAMANGKTLGMIDLSYNQITQLNKLTLNVKPVQLYLDYNKLSGQPFPDEGADFCTMADVETFSCVGNQITEFPAKLFTSNSRYVVGTINFADNKITHIGGDDAQWDDKGNLTKKASFGGVLCTTLKLDGNRFTGGIPAAFATSEPISEIQSLSMKSNQLDSLGWQGMKGMYSLVAIDFESNNIKVITKKPDFYMGREAPYLNGVNLNYNSFKEFPEMLFNSLGINQFWFEGQYDRTTGDKTFRTWPDGIETYMGLRVLKMAGNDIRKVKTFPSLLNFLTIEDNPNIDMVIDDATCARIVANMFYFTYDKTQEYITGCPELGIGDTK